ncbi:type II toxin-antitoxin system RelE/ParE family toxin [bacterium]|nr:type II toxin-antitoxin system RelE/ParE family toxin [bacterium]
MYQIRWSRRATKELQTIRDYIAEHNEYAATQVTERILKQVSLLESVPQIGAPYTDAAGRPARQLVSGRYRILYRFVAESDRIDILSIWHSARRDPDLS